MKRYLLSVMLCVVACVSAWGYTIDIEKKWYGPNSEIENVAKISGLTEAGQLSGALNELATKDYEYQVLYISGYNTWTFNESDLAALATINCATLDLQGMFTGQSGKASEPFTFSNPNIKRVILPDSWDKAAVKAAALAIINGNATIGGNSGFEAALSQDAPQNNYNTNEQANFTPAGLAAYVNKPNTLALAIRHTYFDGISNGNKLGAQGQYKFELKALKYFYIMGYPSARDMSGAASNEFKFDENGHLVFNEEADEISNVAGMGVSGNQRYLLGEAMDGAIKGASLLVLDMSDAVIYEQWNADITLSWLSCIDANTRQVLLPTNPELKTIPADMLCANGNGFNSLYEIYIPGNIEYIRTRAFATTSRNLRHIWTMAPTADENDHTVYDNGAWKTDGSFYSGQLDIDDYDKVKYGTITLPSTLKLIESHAFGTCQYFHDLYVISEHAPECHVDAFSTVMYNGNTTYDSSAITDGVIDRDAYANSLSAGMFMTLFHYPRTATDPDIQRYTDPTRRYSVATGMRDGNGNILYFPNLSEFNRAYNQGTFGYVWNAWDPTRSADGNNAVEYGESLSLTAGHEQAGGQKAANDLWLNNTAYQGDDKNTRSFYDVRLDENGQPTLAQPTGLEWYYNTTYRGIQLYPERKTFETEVYYYADAEGDYVLDQATAGGFRLYNGSADDALQRYSKLQEQATDGEGNLLYEQCSDGAYVQDYEMTPDAKGWYIHDITIEENPDGGFVKDYKFEADNVNGTYYHPFAKVNAPADIWNGDYDPKDYWYASGYEYKVDSENGTWRYSWDQWSERGTFLTWNPNDTQLADYDAIIPSVRVVTGYTQCDSKDLINNHSSELYQVSTDYALYSSSVTDFIAGVNDTKYRKDYKDTYRAYNEPTDAGEQRYDVEDNGYVEYNESTDAGKQRYTKNYIANSYHLATAADGNEPRYCPKMEDVQRTSSYLVANDYRGWHQFVLTAYTNNSDIPTETVRFYQTDNDWWTVCLPYDLKYSEMKTFFGNESTSAIPYLSKLRYVVRDYTDKKITLMFSKNLMVYKESITGDNVHGTIDDVTEWSTSELAADPIILHAGVPYLIRPNIDTNASRQFDVFLSEQEDLYKRLKEAQERSGSAMNSLIYNGEYTVPAYIVGESSESTVTSREIRDRSGYTVTYNSGEITYKGATVSANVSNDYTYTFVGSFFLSLMPQYSYFLGYDSDKKCAAFWYNQTPDKSNYTWNNQTGIICPNFNTSLNIDPASSLTDPARWVFGDTDCKSDDLIGVTGAKSYVMDFGGDMSGVVDGISLREDAESLTQPTVAGIYDLQGVKRAQSLENLPKGVYIVNGKKYVVK